MTLFKKALLLLTLISSFSAFSASNPKLASNPELYIVNLTYSMNGEDHLHSKIILRKNAEGKIEETGLSNNNPINISITALNPDPAIWKGGKDGIQINLLIKEMINNEEKVSSAQMISKLGEEMTMETFDEELEEEVKIKMTVTKKI